VIAETGDRHPPKRAIAMPETGDRDARNGRSPCRETTDRHAPKQPIVIERNTHSGRTRFDRERIVLYVGAAVAIALVAAIYVAGYLVPARYFVKAVVSAANADKEFPAGCYLLFMEHANRLQSAYALRFLEMLIGASIAFVGMMFTIKGLEAGYSLDFRSRSSTASLRTASPGLVLCTIGVLLVATSVLHSSELNFRNTSRCFQ
jgi:hypothetical protein